MKIRNQKGQSLIEACLIAPIILLVFFGVVFLSFRGFLYYYADFQLYEAMICTEHSPARSCQSALEKKIRSILIWGKLEKVSLQNNSYEIKGQLVFSFHKKTFAHSPQLELRKRLSLPLR